MAKRRTQSEVHIAFAKLIDELIRIGDGGWSPTSILYRVMTEGHVHNVGRPGHKILAPELHELARWIQPAFNALPLGDKIIVITKHRPKPEGYEKWGNREMARYLNETSEGAFKAKYNKILKKVKNELT